MSDLADFVAALVGPGGVLVGILGTAGFQKRKAKQELAVAESHEALMEAQAAETLAKAAAALVLPLKSEIESLSERVRTLEVENRSTRAKLCGAIDYIRELRGWISEHLPDKCPPETPDSLKAV